MPGVEALSRKQPSSTGRLSSDCSLLHKHAAYIAFGWPSSPDRNHTGDIGLPRWTLGKGLPTLIFKTLLSFLLHIQQPATSPARLTSTSVSGSRNRPAALTG